MSYFEYNVNLSKGQKEKMLKSYQKKAPFTLRLKNSQLTGSDPLMLTQTQIKRIERSKRDGTGTDIRISSAQMRKQDGGSLFSAIMPLLTKTVMPLVSKAAGPLVSGALSGLSSFGVNKILGSGLFSIPQDKVDKLMKYKSYLTEAQKKQIVEALQTGSGIPVFRLTKQQHGEFLGTLLASIGVPLLLNALTGKGLQVDPHASMHNVRNIYVPSKGGMMVPYQTPPFYGSWDNPVALGIKKKPKKNERKEGMDYS